MTPVHELELRLAELGGQRLVLDERKREELAFHDQRRPRRLAGIDIYRAAALSAAHVDGWIEREAPGRVFLDYACGEGLDGIRAARSGARLAIGLDLSGVSLEKARARAAGLRNTRFLQADAEETGLPPGSVERVVCRGALHHLDLGRALPELERILAPGGRILVLEALGYNPAIRLYRRLTPGRRTGWERSHILTLADLREAGRRFDLADLRFWHIASLLGAFARPLMPALEAIDSILTRIPLVQLASWIFTFELRKRRRCGAA